MDRLTERTETGEVNVGAIVFSIALLIVLVPLGFFLFDNLATEPKLSTDGKTVLVDPYGRAKDLLTIVFPLVTTAAAFWFGSRGTAQAQQLAKTAQDQLATEREATRAKQVRIDNILKKFPDATEELS